MNTSSEPLLRRSFVGALIAVAAAARDVKDLVALAKARPGSLSYASADAGTPPHLAAELFKLQAGIFATHIPYRGAAPALQDVMASQAD